MTTFEILELRDRFAMIRLNTPLCDAAMGEALTDAVDELTVWANDRRIRELDARPVFYPDFVDYWTERFQCAPYGATAGDMQ